MNKTRLTILPLLAVIFSLLLGWSTISAQTIEKFENQILQIEALPSGSRFSLTITQDDLTAAAEEMLARYKTDIEDSIQQAIGVRLSVSDPKISFGNSEMLISARGGKGFLKVNASLKASINWDGNTISVDVKSIDLPIVSVDPATVNAYLQGPLSSYVEQLKQYYEIISFTVSEGNIKSTVSDNIPMYQFAPTHIKVSAYRNIWNIFHILHEIVRYIYRTLPFILIVKDTYIRQRYRVGRGN